jgi:hypothetical protein
MTLVRYPITVSHPEHWRFVCSKCVTTRGVSGSSLSFACSPTLCQDSIKGMPDIHLGLLTEEGEDEVARFCHAVHVERIKMVTRLCFTFW